MLVFVAGDATAGESEIGLRQVFRRDCGSLTGDDLFGIVTLGACKPRVLAVQHEPGLCMIEILGIPSDQLEVQTVMLRVALDAVLTGRIRPKNAGVVSATRFQATGDVLVAIKAAQLRRPCANGMATDASRRAVPFFVCF